MLDTLEFRKVVSLTPLVSLDFIVVDSKNNVLLGKRKNNPAKDMWFVPGGRIFKNEAIFDAQKRILLNEIGGSCEQIKVQFYGVFEHFYRDSAFDECMDTHYVVLAHKVSCNHIHMGALPKTQHVAWSFFSQEELLQDEGVHQYVKNYFLKGK